MGNKGKSRTVAAVYNQEVDDPQEIETRCPYPKCRAILFKGRLGAESNVEFMCQRCGNKLRIQVISPT